MLALPDVLPDLAGNKLMRLLPELHSDAGIIPLYYASLRLLPREDACVHRLCDGEFLAARLRRKASMRRGTSVCRIAYPTDDRVFLDDKR
jgi:hypothetical protein